jgi:hypothetical protein
MQRPSYRRWRRFGRPPSGLTYSRSRTRSRIGEPRMIQRRQNGPSTDQNQKYGTSFKPNPLRSIPTSRIENGTALLGIDLPGNGFPSQTTTPFVGSSFEQTKKCWRTENSVHLDSTRRSIRRRIPSHRPGSECPGLIALYQIQLMIGAANLLCQEHLLKVS